ncbi:MAG: saccharopine dehydrogenase [Balneolaceae bacterium]|nr:MAG: saccharopine dehydrogenase [Balneolaceae bacterium]
MVDMFLSNKLNQYYLKMIPMLGLCKDFNGFLEKVFLRLKRKKMPQIVVYGSYGFTGNLIAEIASKSDKNVLLSGRDPLKLQEQGARLKLNTRVAALDSGQDLDALLKDASVVIHCAGPFVHTWKPMADACLRNGCHYLDITGEVSVFESLKKMDDAFGLRGLMAMPGVGFDVVPTDCMAALLKKEQPDATHLEMAFMGLGGGVSRGTAKTMIENLGKGGLVRQEGVLKRVRTAHKTRRIDFIEKRSQVVTIPWGDLSTAFTSTGIPNVTVYMSATKSMIRSMRLSNYLAPLLRMGIVRKRLEKTINQRQPGPDKRSRENGAALIWGEVRNDSGEIKRAVFKTAEGYRLTAEMAWSIAGKVQSGFLKEGYQTPSSVYGGDLIFEHPDTGWLEKP